MNRLKFKFNFGNFILNHRLIVYISFIALLFNVYYTKHTSAFDVKSQTLYEDFYTNPIGFLQTNGGTYSNDTELKASPPKNGIDLLAKDNNKQDIHLHEAKDSKPVPPHPPKPTNVDGSSTQTGVSTENHAGNTDSPPNLPINGVLKPDSDKPPAEPPEKSNSLQYAIITISFFTLIFSIIFQSFGEYIESLIDKQNDVYVSNVFNTCCRQITTISTINIILWTLLHSRAVFKIDQKLFKSLPYFVNAKLGFKYRNVNISTFEAIFENMLYISVLLMMWYIGYSLFFYVVVRKLIKWMQKSDELDLDLTIRKIDYLNKKWFPSLFYGRYFSKWQFLALRYDFEENVNRINIQGLGTAGYYFFDYLRVSLLEKSFNLLKFPNSSLFLALFVIIGLGYKINEIDHVYLICSLISVCYVFILILYIYIRFIYNKLLPSNLSHYLSSRKLTDDDLQNSDSLRYDESLQPRYKANPLKPLYPRFYTEFLYGTLNPNKHEQLFVFLSNGPHVLLAILTTLNFSVLILLSVWVCLLVENYDHWFIKHPVALVYIPLSSLAICSVWPDLLYLLVIISNGGMMVNIEKLSSVWETKRAENTKHAIELIDGIGIHAGLYSLASGGDMQWRYLLGKFKAFSVAEKEKLISSWNKLHDNNGKSGNITIKQAARYLYSQGLTNIPPKLVNDFIKSFSRTIPGKLSQEEFLMFALMIKLVIISPLDKVTLLPLFEDVYKISWNNETGINCLSLQCICQQIGLKWSYGARRHLIEFLSNGTRTQMSPEDFVSHMRDFEEYILKKAQDSSRYLIHGNDSSRSQTSND